MNGRLSQILGSNEQLYPHKLDAAYPRILEKIADLWNTSAMGVYFDDLLLDSRGDRQGFPGDVLNEIFALRNYYYSLQPTPAVTIHNWPDAIELERLEKRGE